MKKSFYLIIPALILSLVLLNGCGFPTVIVKRNISINVYDKDTKYPLTDVSVSIFETGFNAVISGNPYQKTLDQSSYTMYLSKQGYITKGFVFYLNSNLAFNVYLVPVNKNVTLSYEDISGQVLENGSNYSGSFNVYAGNLTTADVYEDLTNPIEVSSVCGNIAVSAYTKNGEDLDKISYLKTTLSPGIPLTDLSLELPANPTVYSGSKPGWDWLVVKQNDGYILARQFSISSNYSFGVGLAPGDGIILESSQNLGNTNYFTRMDAGGNGGTHNLQYQTEIPYSFVDSLNYTIQFSEVSFASYYEVYAIQIKDGEGTVPFQTIVLSGSSVKIPNNLFESGAAITIYIRAINLAGFDMKNVINGSQIYTNYSYVETIDDYSFSSLNSCAVLQQKKIEKINTEVRSRFSLNYLCAE